MSSDHPPTVESTTEFPTNATATEPDSTAAAQDTSIICSSSPSSCEHSIPPSITPQLSEPTACPTCIITSDISDILDVQFVLRTRGGVFFSRGRPKSDKHRALMDRWRKAKVELLNLVSILETSILDHPTEEWKDVKEALGVWEREKEILAKVPGTVYEGEEVKLSEDVAAMVEGMLEDLKSSIHDLLLEDGPEVVVPAKDEASSDLGTTTSTSAPSSTSISIAIPEQEAASEFTSTVEIRPRSRSILKRKSSNHDSPPLAQKRIRIADFATVSSEHLTISNPSPFLKLSTDEPVQLHSLFTYADHSRRKSYFARSSGSYLPGAWSSPAFCSKPNTSCFKLAWNEVEEMWKKEEEEVAEERRVHERLRVIAEVHTMCWWVRSVASHVGLEKVAKIGQAAAESKEARSDGGDGMA